MPDGHLLSYPILALDRVTAKRKSLINWLWYRNVPKGDDLNGLLTDRDGSVATMESKADWVR